ncbi:hypothetical protein DICPUDRAFT_78821 [Dictyostelium purpureum]|uniref:Serine aminopeptidase S33 domain-containing protein n=1 Tax=Dictyostelium purpureum TaxID=5786 RepID=F0ZKN6_DICPU|nr:uncharacterized protein DICPUDRAFT_78821 [Dictyostelium purpureum]EGC35492.1 hypothetical protein DICPUDRAFT_78821 [Dictyostelium purpureum]|eukprot:XP_003287971.1 hypothetical protein DICPUDRAFT_78821 [Dictyostelium purpureum]
MNKKINKTTTDKNKKTQGGGFRKCLLVTSIVIGLLSTLIPLIFIGFCSQALLYFPWWRGVVANTTTNPMSEFSIEYENISFKSFDNANLTINGWWVPSKESNNQNICIVSVHGSGRDRYEWFSQIPVYHNEGISILTYDSIDGVGQSDGLGRGIGYSYREHKDVRAAIRLLKDPNQKYNQHCKKIILTGMSLGGGSVIIAGAKDKDLIDGVIAESPYSNAQNAWRHNIFRFLNQGVSSFFPFIKAPYDEILLPKNPPEWIVKTILMITEKRILFTDTNITENDTPINYVDKISPKPLLLIHATHDPVVPHIESVRLYEKSNQPKELWTVYDKHTHQTAVHSASKSEYLEKLRNFIKQL